MSAAAEMTLGVGGCGAGDCEADADAGAETAAVAETEPAVPSALRFRESLLEMGLMSLAVSVSTVLYDLKETT